MEQFKLTNWPAASRHITQEFGVDRAFYQREFGTPGHMGIDVGGTEGVTDIYAAADGQVSRTGFHAVGYGHHVYIRHAGGYTTIYAHLHTRPAVKQGQVVTSGTFLGKLGNSGTSTGPHLQFEMRGPKGDRGWPRNIIDPTPFVNPLLGFVEPAGPYKEGWAVTWAVLRRASLAQAGRGGVSLRAGSSQMFDRLGIIPEGSLMIITGPAQNGYYPVKVPFVTLGERPPQLQHA